MNKLKGISVILPTLNEEENLKELIPEIVEILENIEITNYELIVVDDSSEDQTEELIKKMHNENRNIKFFARKNERSLPISILDGINQSIYEHVMWLDADGSMNADSIKKLLEKLNENTENVIIGSRFVEGGGYKGIEEVGTTSFFSAMYNVSKSNDSVLATILSKIFNNILFVLTPTNVKDLTSGFIVGKKEYFDSSIFLKSSYGDYFVYLVNSLHSKNIVIQEVGYLCEMRIHGESKTGSSIVQLIKRGLPYILAAVRCRMGNNENLL